MSKAKHLSWSHTILCLTWYKALSLTYTAHTNSLSNKTYALALLPTATECVWIGIITHTHTYIYIRSDTLTTHYQCRDVRAAAIFFLHHIIQCVSTMKRLSNYPLLSNFIKPTNSLYQLSRYIYSRLHGMFLSYMCAYVWFWFPTIPAHHHTYIQWRFYLLISNTIITQSFHYNAVNAFITLRDILCHKGGFEIHSKIGVGVAALFIYFLCMYLLS